MTNDELIEYYKNLLIIQYYDKPKARAEIGLLVSQTIASQIVSQVLNGFDIETVIGAQLDIIAAYVGVNRIVNGLNLDKSFFGMPDYNDPDVNDYPGFQSYTDIDTDIINYFEKYADIGNRYSLSDYELRQLIKFKIRVNKTDCSLYDIDNIIYDFFGADCLVTDNGAMSLTYAFTPGLTYNLPKIVVYTNILPRPAGVTINVTGII